MRLEGELRVVAYLYILHGIGAILRMFFAIAQNHVRIDIGALCLFAGFGLLRLSVGWWNFAKIYNMLYLIGMPIAMLFVVGAKSSLSASILGVPIGNATKEALLLLCGIGWFVTCWEYLVLTSNSSRKLFESSSEAY